MKNYPLGAREPEVQIQILNVDQMLNSEGATPEGGFAFERESHLIE